MSGKMSKQEKAREANARRLAARQGLQLTRSRVRDARAFGFGGYMLIDADVNTVVYGAHPYAYSLDLDEVEAYLNENTPPAKQNPSQQEAGSV